MLSPETLKLFGELLEQVTLPAKHPDFEKEALRIATAKRELAEAQGG